jgi:hypothetical protein
MVRWCEPGAWCCGVAAAALVGAAAAGVTCFGLHSVTGAPLPAYTWGEVEIAGAIVFCYPWLLLQHAGSLQVTHCASRLGRVRGACGAARVRCQHIAQQWSASSCVL